MSFLLRILYLRTINRAS